MTLALLVGGLLLLIAGGELLVRGASKLAISTGISPLVVGLTVVAFGTSSPELALSVQAVAGGEVDLALGNVVGSNILNILFILGLAALITPLVVDGQIIRQEVPILIGASLLLFAFSQDGEISRGEGGVFVALLIIYSTFLIWQSRRQTAELQSEYAGERHIADSISRRTHWDEPMPVQLALIAGGLALLLVGSRWLVIAATTIAQQLGVSELIIGLTILAAGTSMPEVAATLAAAIKGQRDIAVGNAIGSSIFNILCVVGFSSLIAPAALPVAPALLRFDMPVMIAVAVACLPIFFTGRSIARWEGAVFLGYYAAYTLYLILASQQHNALSTYTLVMQSFVLPLTALTLVVVVGRALRARALPNQ